LKEGKRGKEKIRNWKKKTQGVGVTIEKSRDCRAIL